MALTSSRFSLAVGIEKLFFDKTSALCRKVCRLTLMSTHEHKYATECICPPEPRTGLKNELLHGSVKGERSYSLGYDVEIAIDPDKPIKEEVARTFEEATQLKPVLIENPLVAIDASSWSWVVEDDENSDEFLVVFKKVAQE